MKCNALIGVMITSVNPEATNGFQCHRCHYKTSLFSGTT
jgi:hypothetical protein